MRWGLNMESGGQAEVPVQSEEAIMQLEDKVNQLSELFKKVMLAGSLMLSDAELSRLTFMRNQLRAKGCYKVEPESFMQCVAEVVRCSTTETSRINLLVLPLYFESLFLFPKEYKNGLLPGEAFCRYLRSTIETHENTPLIKRYIDSLLKYVSSRASANQAGLSQEPPMAKVALLMELKGVANNVKNVIGRTSGSINNFRDTMQDTAMFLADLFVFPFPDAYVTFLLQYVTCYIEIKTEPVESGRDNVLLRKIKKMACLGSLDGYYRTLCGISSAKGVINPQEIAALFIAQNSMFRSGFQVFRDTVTMQSIFISSDRGYAKVEKILTSRLINKVKVIICKNKQPEYARALLKGLLCLYALGHPNGERGVEDPKKTICKRVMNVLYSPDQNSGASDWPLLNETLRGVLRSRGILMFSAPSVLTKLVRLVELAHPKVLRERAVDTNMSTLTTMFRS